MTAVIFTRVYIIGICLHCQQSRVDLGDKKTRKREKREKLRCRERQKERGMAGKEVRHMKRSWEKIGRE